MQKITPFLWFDGQAEEAIDFYTSIFDGGEVLSIRRHPDGPLEGPMQGMEGKVLTAVFSLGEQQFMALDGGPYFKLNPSVSFFVSCATEAEVDSLWHNLAEGGSVLMPLQAYPFSQKFGWIEDKYGLSWQLNLAQSQQKIAPFLLFVGPQHGRAEEAIHAYTALFANSEVDHLVHFGSDAAGEVEGTVQHAAFTLNGQAFMAMDSNLGHTFTFNEAISFYVSCATQAEVDYYWENLSADPAAEQCGWLKDKFGFSWQIIPAALPEMLDDPDPEKARRVMETLLQMKKIDIAALERAQRGGD